MCLSDEQYPHGLYKTTVTGGYESYHLFDDTDYTFSFCEKCLRQLFNQCKIKPIVESIAARDLTYEEDREAYEYRFWKDNGGHHQAYLDRKCNAAKDCPHKAVYTVRYDGDFTEDAVCGMHKDHYKSYNRTLVQFIPHVLKPFL